MEKPEVVDPLKEEEVSCKQPKPSVEEQTEETMGVRGLAEEDLVKWVQEH